MGQLVRAAELDGAGDVTGFFIVTATSDAEAKRLADASPHIRYRGTIEVRRLVRQ